MTPETPDHTIAALRERYGERYRWLLLISVMVGTMASIMSSTIVNVAVPDLMRHFAIGQERGARRRSRREVTLSPRLKLTERRAE